MALFRGLPGWAGARRRNLLNFMVQGNITEADTPTIWLCATPSGLISDPPPSSLHCYAGCHCPSCLSPPNLSWPGTGTKYAGSHTQWLGLLHKIKTVLMFCWIFIVRQCAHTSCTSIVNRRKQFIAKNWDCNRVMLLNKRWNVFWNLLLLLFLFFSVWDLAVLINTSHNRALRHCGSTW